MQPVRMSAAEYKSKYGVAPTPSSSDLDTSPVPIRMTRAEYNTLYRPQPKTYAQDFLSDIKETGTAMKQAVNQGADLSGSIDRNVASGETGKVSGLFQKVGTGLGTASSAIFQGALGVAKAVLPQGAEERVAETLGEDLKEIFAPETRKQFVDRLKESEGGALLNTQELDRKTGVFLEEVGEAYRNDENFRNTVLAAGGIAEWLALPATAETAVARTADVLGDAAQQSTKLRETARVVADSFANSRNDSRVANVADEILAIENKYAPLRRKMDVDPNAQESRIRIAQSNVLANAVDEDGLIRTKAKGGAVDAYRAATIEGVEDVVKRNLELEGKSINLKELENDLLFAVTDSNLEGADLAKAIRGIENEIKGLAIRADEFGNLPLTKLQDAKTSTYKHIDYTKPTGVTYRKALARTYKEAIERKSDLNIREVNAELAKYYKDLDRLADLDGRRVRGGRLGKYTSALVGSGVGAIGGSAAGGAGAIAGGLIGGELSAMIKGKSMAGTFNKGVRGDVPENRTLQQAREAAERGEKDLRNPDIQVGAPKDLLDNPKLAPEIKDDILRTESRIKNNIKQQQAAIKANDFTLVAALKEVYQALTQKLEELIRAAKENITDPSKSQGGYIKNPLYRERNSDQASANNMPTTIQNIDSTVPDAKQTVKADVEDSIVMENLMRLDPMEADPADFERLNELKKIAEKRALDEDELLEAQRIVEDTQGQLPEVEAATTKTTDLPSTQYKNKELNFVYNTKKADLGDQDFAQDIEPAGRYMNVGFDEFPGGEGMVKGTVTFKNPLVIEWETSRTGGWKTKLSERYDGKTGKELSQVIKDDGYDGIIAVTGDIPKEAVNLQTFNGTTDLLEEARKYDSAEEFVKAQGDIVYHGSEQIFSDVGNIDFEQGFYTLRRTKGEIDANSKTFEEPPLPWVTNQDIKKYLSGQDYKRYEEIINTPDKELSKKDILKLDSEYNTLRDKAATKKLSAEGNNTRSLNDWMKEPAEAFGGNVNEFVVEFNNPLIVDVKGKSWLEISDGEMSDYTLTLINKAKKNENDGVIIRNITEGFSGKSKLGAEAGLVDDYIALSPETIRTRTQLEDIWKQANKK